MKRKPVGKVLTAWVLAAAMAFGAVPASGAGFEAEGEDFERVDTQLADQAAIEMPIEVWSEPLTGPNPPAADKMIGSYDSLSAAFSASQDGNRVYIRDNYTLSEDVTIPSGVYLEVYGRNTAEGYAGATLIIPEGKTLTVAEDCKQLSVWQGCVLDVLEGGTVLLAGGSYKTLIKKGCLYFHSPSDGTEPGRYNGRLSVPEGDVFYRAGAYYWAGSEADAAAKVTDASQNITYCSENSISGTKLSSGETITLLKDYANPWTISSDNTTVDLGGFTWSGSATGTASALTINGKNVRIQNGTVQAGANAQHAVEVSGSAIVADDAVIAGGKNSSIFMGANGELTVYGTVENPSENGRMAISGNGSGSYDHTVITIKDGANVIAASTAIYHPQIGVLNIEGGTITGATGVEFRSGTLNMSKGSVNGTGSFSAAANENGPTTSGVGIAVVQHVTKNPIDVNITGGTVEGTQNALYQNDLHGNSTENVIMKVSGGSFAATSAGSGASAVFSGDNVKSFITGGSFSSDPSSYIDSGNDIVIKEDGSFEVKKPYVPPYIYVDSVSITPASLTLEAGDIQTVEFEVLPSYANNTTLRWTSSAEEVAVVSDGMVTAVAEGTAVITAAAQDGSGKYAECKVTVNPKPVLLPTKLRTVGRTEGQVNLKWTKVERAEGYTIWYRSEYEEKVSRKIIHGNTATSWTHKGLKPGTKYFYTIRPWIKDKDGYVFGESSPVQRGTTMPMAARIKSVKVSGGKLKVILDGKAAGARGYSMCYSKDAKYAKFQVGIRTKYTVRTFTKTLGKGTYFIRVKSYRDLGNGKRVYGKWSNMEKAVVK